MCRALPTDLCCVAERLPPPPAGGPVGRTHRKEGCFLGCMLTILCLRLSVPGACNFPHFVCACEEVAISLSQGFPEESNKNSQRLLHTEQGREVAKGFYLLLRRITDNPTYTPLSPPRQAKNNFSFKVTFSLVESGNGDIGFWFR